MGRRYWTRNRRKVLGTALVVVGVILWALAATLFLIPQDARDVSISHFEMRSIGVAAGGAFIAAGIILIATAV